MNYHENAAQGIKKVYTAEVLALVSKVIMGIFLIAGILLGAAASTRDSLTDSTAEKLGISIGITIFIAVISLIIIVVSFFMQLSGLNTAGKDNKNFKIAFIITIVTFILSVISVFLFKQNTRAIMELFSSIASLAAIIYVCNGIKELLPGTDIASNSTRIIIIIVISAVSSLLSGLFSSVGIAVFFSIISLICGIVYYIMYISLLGKASKALAVR